MSSSALDRFLRYVQIETTSQADVDCVPSTDCQFDLARLLVDELKQLGLEDVRLDDHCYVTATLPANRLPDGTDVPVVGLIAHMDTSPEVSGRNVRPILHDYSGGDIKLPGGTVIAEDDALRGCVGHRIVTSDGTTLLGADNKAGIAAVMATLQRLQTEDRPHGTIRICFTPDEEVGNGTAFFDIETFGADFAYTVDGELPGELNRETFTAESASIDIIGRDVHPGAAKNIMVNALRAMSNLIASLPSAKSPETTEDREPFIHPCQMSGGVGHATTKVLLRAFCDSDMERLRQEIESTATSTRRRFPGATVDIAYKNQYRNMWEGLDKHPEILSRLEKAARRSGVEAFWKPIRGGTDGARLTEMGLPTPNIYTGGHHFHSPMEWLSVEHLETTVETLVQLAVVWSEQTSRTEC